MSHSVWEARLKTDHSLFDVVQAKALKQQKLINYNHKTHYYYLKFVLSDNK